MLVRQSSQPRVESSRLTSGMTGYQLMSTMQQRVGQKRSFKAMQKASKSIDDDISQIKETSRTINEDEVDVSDDVVEAHQVMSKRQHVSNNPQE